MNLSIENSIIAVDFDGTIVTHRFPEIGAEIPFAIETLKALQRKGFRLILWTFRSGKSLEEAVAYCQERGVVFYAVNKNYPEEIFDDGISRKIKADIYIDDRNICGLPQWGAIHQMLCPEEDENFIYNRKRGFLRRLFGS